MSRPSPDPRRSVFDLPYEAGAERIAALRAERHRTRLFALGHRPARREAGAVHRLRAALGRALITVGSAIDPGPVRPAPAARGGTAVSR